MKLYPVLVFLFFFLMQEIQGQEFAPIGSEWYYTNLENWFGQDFGFVKIQSIGDTLIQGITCKHLTKTRYGAHGSISQESDEFLFTDGDVVYRFSDNDTFYVLYNFAAQIGDTWTTRTYDLYAQQDVETIFQVEDISTTIISGETLRELYVTPISGFMSFGSSGFSWGTQGVAHITEKLGGGGYMFPQDYGLWDFEVRIGLRCYNGPVLGNINTGITDECDELITISSNDIIEGHDIKIFPNPSFGELTIYVNQDLKDIDFISIYSVEGKLINEFKIDSFDVELKIEFEVKGIYFIEFTGKNYRSIRKAVIN